MEPFKSRLESSSIEFFVLRLFSDNKIHTHLLEKKTEKEEARKYLRTVSIMAGPSESSSVTHAIFLPSHQTLFAQISVRRAMGVDLGLLIMLGAQHFVSENENAFLHGKFSYIIYFRIVWPSILPFSYSLFTELLLFGQWIIL